jgi:myo-inositol-1(or 4)-monophosphatase
MTDDDPIDDWLEVCQAAARAGGRELIAWRGHFQTREKGRTDLVTDADLASQAAVRDVIAARFPDHSFVGEEQPPGVRTSHDDELVWIVDPLDGTTNYVHGYPCYAVSVALARAGKPLVGAIFDPLIDDMYVAVAGHGAWCNGERIGVSSVTDLEQSLVSISLPPQVPRDSPDLLDFVEVVQICQGVRRTGSAALNLAFVARGFLDAFWANFIHPWDVAAGVLLVSEAGGIVTARDGREFDLWNPPFLAAANPQLHAALLGVLTPFQRSGL